MNDLFGNPIGQSQPLDLTLWQKKQATILNHFSSIDYLNGLLFHINNLFKFIDPTMELAQAQDRDSIVISERWGIRDTVTNWSTHAYPKLMDLKLSIQKQIVERAFEKYSQSSTYEVSRALEEISTNWATIEEEDAFREIWNAICQYSSPLDDTCHTSYAKWNDFNFAVMWHRLAPQYKQLPKFKIRTDIVCETGKTPPRTGVYISKDDSFGSLQFAWTGGYGELKEENTFTAIGIEALHAVGRRKLWTDGQEMSLFATKAVLNHSTDLFLPYDKEDADDTNTASSMVAMAAFTSKPCKWYYVELINGEYEDLAALEAAGEQAEAQRIRVLGGQPCPQPGYYFTPAKTNSRRNFKQGEPMPNLGGDYGVTIWQLDDKQD